MVNVLVDNCFVGDIYSGNGGGGANALYAMYTYGGNGGNGGDIIISKGLAIFTDNSQIYAVNLTISENHVQDIIPGVGGSGGTATGSSSYPGDPGIPGSITAGGEILYNDRPNGVSEICNSIIYGNYSQEIFGEYEVNHSCIEGGFVGMGNISNDPEFVSIPIGNCFLSQLESGQQLNSPCVDTGDPNSALVEGTTRTDGEPDTDIPDMGYHYNIFTPTPFLTVEPVEFMFNTTMFSGNPPAQQIVIDNNGIGSFDYTIIENCDWISLSQYSGGPLPPADTITIEIDIDDLFIGEYRDSLIIEAEGIPGSPVFIPVSLTIEGPILNISPDSMYFLTGQVIPPPEQTFFISNDGVDTLFITLEEDAEWLNLSTYNPVILTRDSIEVSIDVSGLAPGNYEEYILVFAESALNSPDTLNIYLEVQEGNIISGPQSGIFPQNSVYTVVSNISVEESDSLIIEPGVKLLFLGNYWFNVSGQLEINGTYEDSVIFTTVDTSLVWAGIHYHSLLEDSIVISYCSVSNSNGNGIRIDGRYFELQNSSFSNCHTGLYIYDSNSNSKMQNDILVI